jgi:hypothetical protein
MTLMWNSKRVAKTFVTVVAALGMAASAANARSGPFASMAGTWAGEGRVVLSDGQVERIRCQATDEVEDGGNAMRQHLRCASASYHFDVQNAVTHRQGMITGNWNETTRNVGGQVTGAASGNTVRARVEAGQFTADVTLAPRGNSLIVSLTPHGSNVQEVSVMLRRA